MLLQKLNLSIKKGQFIDPFPQYDPNIVSNTSFIEVNSEKW